MSAWHLAGPACGRQCQHSALFLLGVIRPDFHSFVCWCIKMELVAIQFKMCFWVPVKDILLSYLVSPYCWWECSFKFFWLCVQVTGDLWSSGNSWSLAQCLIGKRKCVLLVVLARSYLDGRHILGRKNFWCAVAHPAGIGKSSSEDSWCGVCWGHVT